jgi:hypothetical protein
MMITTKHDKKQDEKKRRKGVASVGAVVIPAYRRERRITKWEKKTAIAIMGVMAKKGLPVDSAAKLRKVLATVRKLDSREKRLVVSGNVDATQKAFLGVVHQ